MNPIQMMQQFNNFRKNYTNETAEQQVRQLVASGKINQQQLNQLQNMAIEFQALMKNNFR